jgi:hypothetical protein
MDDTNAVGGSAVGGRELTVPAAARVLGISERAVRWRIQAGTIGATRNGRAWTVYVPADNDPVVDAVVVETQRGSDAVVELARQLQAREGHVRDLERTNMELAGQVGYLQAELAQAREQLALAPPVDATPAPVDRPSWWRRIIGA